jgi:hypothetical protein
LVQIWSVEEVLVLIAIAIGDAPLLFVLLSVARGLLWFVLAAAVRCLLLLPRPMVGIGSLTLIYSTVCPAINLAFLFGCSLEFEVPVEY